MSCLLTAPETRLTVTSNDIELGSHTLPMLAGHTAFHVSSYTTYIEQQRPHLQLLLATLPLKCLHWINFNHQDITLTTLLQ